jgi:hypothetical protein
MLRGQRFAAGAAAISLLLAGCTAPFSARHRAPSPAGRLQSPSPGLQISGRAGIGACTAEPPVATEPSLAVDPANPNVLIAAWQQRAVDGLAIVIGSSTDGGRRWTTTLMPGLTHCSGGDFAGTSDPWVSIGADGTAYTTALAIRSSGARFGGVVVSTSSDHGVHWSRATPIVANDDPLSVIDKEVVLADPKRPGVAYCVWVLYRLANPNETPRISSTAFARSEDGGRTWSAPLKTYGVEDENQNHLLGSLPDGTLLDFFSEAEELPGPETIRPLPVQMRVMRSTDQGRTWSAPATIGVFTDTAPLDPDQGTGLRLTGQGVAAATGPDGYAYAAWFEDLPGGAARIYVSRSNDGGRSWSQGAPAVSQAAPLLPPVMAVARDGTVGMLWYDFRHHAGGGPLATDVWLTTSRDHGATWSEAHVAGPFDMRAAPRTSGGYFVGDYQGLAGLRAGFAMAFAQAAPTAGAGPAAIFFSRAGS